MSIDHEAAVRLARQFHNTYERLAPKFGYKTRDDTKVFDPQSRNGQLMIAVCETIQLDLAAQLEQERDIRSDLEIVLSLVADGLKVSHEPHQTFTERLLEASCAKGDAALRADNTPKQT